MEMRRFGNLLRRPSQPRRLHSASGLESLPQRLGPILIADDDRDQTDSLAVLFELTGHAVLTAYEGERAFELAQVFCPKWLLLDLSMPSMSGYEVAQQVRALHWGRQAKLLALTGYARREDRQRSLEAGFDYHFVKPVEFGELIAVMKE
jgi:DNA-binding response OmpR family regulator